MHQIDGESLKSVKILPKDLEMAKMTYDTEKYEEDVWKEALDETEEYVAMYEVRMDRLENIVEGLDVKANQVSDNKATHERNLEQINTVYEKIKDMPEEMLTSEQRDFLKNYDKMKHEKEVAIEEDNFSLEELDNAIKKKKNEIRSNQTKKEMVEAHRDLRVKPKYEKEKAEAQDAYDNYQELLKEYKEQGGVWFEL